MNLFLCLFHMCLYLCPVPVPCTCALCRGSLKMKELSNIRGTMNSSPGQNIVATNLGTVSAAATVANTTSAAVKSGLSVYAIIGIVILFTIFASVVSYAKDIFVVPTWLTRLPAIGKYFGGGGSSVDPGGDIPNDGPAPLDYPNRTGSTSGGKLRWIFNTAVASGRAGG